MSLYKRNGIWWTHFFLNGDRYRESLDTTDRREALKREKQRIADVTEGRNLASHKHFARWPFSKAVDHYLNGLKLNLSESSIRTETERAQPLRAFFKERPLARITAPMVDQYQAQRKEQGLSGRTINMEVGILRRILKKAKRWHIIAEDVKMLPERSDIGRAPTPEEKARLLEAATSRPQWQVAHCATVLAANTATRGCELKGLRRKDVDLFERTLMVGRSKTPAGIRVLPLNRDAVAVLAELRDRAEKLAAGEPEHYVFPTCENSHFDPRRPMKTWRTAWRSLTRAADLRGLRFHDLKHLAVTELAERDASDMTIMAIAGHVSRRMLEHYSHIRMEAKRRALDALASGPGRADLESVTTQSTIQSGKLKTAKSGKFLN